MKIITTHINPDFDAIASCIAAKKLYTDAKIAFPKLPERSTKNFIIQSIIYPHLEDNNIDIKDIDTLIIVDTHSKSRIENRFSEIADNVYTICYDHHEEGDINCNECYCKKIGANVTQMVEKILFNNIEINDEEATLFMLGIYEDTGKLSYSSTTPKDIFIASKLLEKNADLDTVRHILEETLSEVDILLLNDLIKNKRVYEINGKRVALSFTSLDEYVSNVATIVNRLITIDKLDGAICIFRMASRIYVIGRSVKNVDILEIMKDIGGGGHKHAASAAIKDMTLIEVAEKLSYSIKMKLLNQIKAKEIMSFPPKYVYSDDTLETVSNIITKSGMNALVVIDKNSKDVVGIITRQIINKAIYHHMNSKKISLFMITEFETVNEDDSFGNIKKIVIDEKQRLIPVLSNGNLVGVITRTNLLKILSDEINVLSSTTLKNITNSIKKVLPLNIIDYLTKAGDLAKNLNFKAYMVGGVVRDIILGYRNLDIDIVIEGNGVKFAKELAKLYSAKVAVHERFKTATVIFRDGLKIDIATAREEYYNLPGALPNVEESSIKLDLYRRDFTINTLAVKLHDNFGDLLDFFGGLKDIKEKKIRVLHILSFVEDPTRMFRAIRFSARFGFNIGMQTDRLIKIAVSLDVLKHVDKTRIFNEIRQILNSNCVKCSFEMMKKYKLLRVLDSQLIIDDRILQYIDIQENIINSCLTICKDKKIKRDLVFIILLEYLLRKSLSFTEAIGADNKIKKIVKENVYKFPLALKTLRNPQSNNLDIYNALSSISIEGILSLYALEKDSAKISNYLENIINTKPLIRGKDLLNLGFKPSKLFSVIIDDIFNQQLLNNIKNKMGATKYILKKYHTHIDKTEKKDY